MDDLYGSLKRGATQKPNGQCHSADCDGDGIPEIQRFHDEWQQPNRKSRWHVHLERSKKDDRDNYSCNDVESSPTEVSAGEQTRRCCQEAHNREQSRAFHPSPELPDVRRSRRPSRLMAETR